MSADPQAALDWALRDAPRVGASLGIGMWSVVPASDHITVLQVRRSLADLVGPAADVVPELPEDSRSMDRVVVFPERQARAAEAQIGLGWSHLKPGGDLWVIAPKRGGAARIGKRLGTWHPEVEVMSKHHCRVFRLVRREGIDDAVPASWAATWRPEQGPSGHMTLPGLFAWDRVDAGSALLANTLPENLAGTAADVGCGWGYLSLELRSRCPQIEVIHMLDDDYRAVQLAQANLAGKGATSARWCDASKSLGLSGLDVVVCNPPFHDGRGATTPDLGRAMIAQCARALHPYGQAWFVANRHLAYERTLEHAFKRFVEVRAEGGFKIIKATQPRRGSV